MWILETSFIDIKEKDMKKYYFYAVYFFKKIKFNKLEN